MNISVTFHIQLTLHKTGKRYRMLVEHYYSSPQVERFKIHGKEKFILMEKLLDRHKQPWKITQGDFDLANVQAAALAIKDMQDAIDNYLTERKNDNRIEGHVTPNK